jgi:hypothetical protein
MSLLGQVLWKRICFGVCAVAIIGAASVALAAAVPRNLRRVDAGFFESSSRCFIVCLLLVFYTTEWLHVQLLALSGLSSCKYLHADSQHGPVSLRISYMWLTRIGLSYFSVKHYPSSAALPLQKRAEQAYSRLHSNEFFLQKMHHEQVQ